MRLNPIATDASKRAEILEDLQRLVAHCASRELRVCQGCDTPCACSGSRTCTCMCSPSCEHAPRAMSSDPDAHPIESGISPLVYGLNCLRVCPPYWSCEGHRFPSGEIMRVPQVWFFTRSLIYPKLISDYLHEQLRDRTISNPWQVSLTYAENSLETGFSIEPDVKLITRPDLESMQRDVGVISDRLVDGLARLAREALSRHNASTASNAMAF